MKKHTVIIIIVLFLLLFLGAYIFYGWLSPQYSSEQLQIENETNPNQSTDNKQENNEEISKVKVPDFTVYDIEGNEVHLSDYIGKPIVLNFWASWCGPCQMEMPEFDKAYKEFEEVQFLMVNMTDGSRETVEKASEFITNSGYSFPVFYDTDLEAAMNYRVYSLPTTIFIDADGYGIAQANGAIDYETLITGIEMILE